MEQLERILHVDDDEDICALTKMALELIGHYKVDQFMSGEAALAAVDRLDVQLFLFDYMIPGMSGVQLWRELRQRPQFEHVPVIFMTAKSEQTFGQSLIDEGALAVIVKPFEITELCGRIEAAWASRQAG
ncbi:response regulator [uncultured Maritimibacter sp.]|jgi:DNA-binding response OmpR family regulator|uniref:response regulator transcription factor n=1 Tax=uncultured Maritimibacter sp. TaxID=991866 RepID=UPI0026050635|nr:response regulator [uncultured Maritimibacter sp.]